MNIEPIDDTKYPWIGQVVHSRVNIDPFMCSASCIKPRIFITAVTCVRSLKVTYTSVLYQSQRLMVEAFVMPSNLTRQAFDDIAFLIVNNNRFKGKWKTIGLFDIVKRTDDNFTWYGRLNFNEHKFKVIGHANSEEKSPAGFPLAKLYELNVVVNPDICEDIYTFNNTSLKGSFRVPCYHSCTFAEFKTNLYGPNCMKYHGTLGSAVINVTSNKLLGVVTWGTRYLAIKQTFPVGFSVPNSPNFFKDMKCVDRIIKMIDFGNRRNFQLFCEDD